MAPKFKVGDILHAINPTMVVIQQCKVLEIDNFYYKLLITRSSSIGSALKVGYIHVYSFNNAHRHYELDQEVMDRIEVEQDIKETFNGG